MPAKTKYTVELLCDYPEWWRYNVYIMAVGFDEEGGAATFNNLTDKVYETGGTARHAAPPDDYAMPRILRIETQECAFADIYIYVVANAFPATAVIGEWPPFPVELRVSTDGTAVSEHVYEVNQWGGLTVAGLRVEAKK
ncbi:MAG: hypothetical protein FWE10_00350 [Rikenellaceae bacterium]|nr:hypothetical protein [Rikenellaceae bacterium]MCL2692189.1 hypothetical protein [Rikenellaceae bacterium]